jgi:galactokinase
VSRAGRVDEVGAGFHATYDVLPSGVWSAPGRVNLMGEHTDYNSGLCLPIALPQRTFVAARTRDDRRLRVRSAQSDEVWEGDLRDIGPGRPQGWSAYVAGVLWALAQDGLDPPGLDLWVEGQVPVGAGLSSSAALECAVAVAVDDLAGFGLGGSDAGRTRLAAACDRAENVVAVAPTGGMDQIASLRCIAGHALLLDCRDGSVEQEPLDLDASGLALLVIDTRAPHQLVDGQYAERRAACEAAARTLGLTSLREIEPADLDAALDRLPDPVTRRRVRHVVTEIDRVRACVNRLQRNDIAALGPIFSTSHSSMRDDYEISCRELDLAVESAQMAGALGARMTGGGFGGSAVALVPAPAVAAVTAAVQGAFAHEALTEPEFLLAPASAGAAREL